MVFRATLRKEDTDIESELISTVPKLFSWIVITLMANDILDADEQLKNIQKSTKQYEKEDIELEFEIGGYSVKIYKITQCDICLGLEDEELDDWVELDCCNDKIHKMCKKSLLSSTHSRCPNCSSPLGNEGNVPRGCCQCLCSGSRRHCVAGILADHLSMERRRLRNYSAYGSPGFAGTKGQAIPGAHDHSAHHLTLFHFGAWDSLFNTDHDDVADRGVLPLRSAKHLDTLNSPCSRIVGNIENCLHLNHGCIPKIIKLFKFVRQHLPVIAY